MKLFYTLLVASALAIVFLVLKPEDLRASNDVYNEKHRIEVLPPCLQMHYCIQKYADEYDVPVSFAYGIANQETGYRGPFQWDYQQSRTSPVGALGAMQIMLPTAKMMWPHQNVTREKLLSSIDFNVETSMKILRHLYNTYGNWKVAFGAYNTGRPIVNSYANNVYNYNIK